MSVVLEMALGWIKSGMFLEILIYAAIVVIAVSSAIKCFPPLMRNARILRRATRKIISESRKENVRPSWNDSGFLGDPMQDAWVSFLRNAEARDAHGETCDVEDYINEDTVVFAASNVQLAEMIPGIMVSLGILGTFLGLVTGLSGLSLMDNTDEMLAAIQQLMSGMSTAFLTSIFGVIASLIFNLLNRHYTGRCESALKRFLQVFHQYAMSKPVDDTTSLVTLQQEQTNYMRQMVEEIALRMATQIEQSIRIAMLPVQRSMDNFIVAATREQIEGMDRVSARFVERMNQVLAGEFTHLGETLERVCEENKRSQDELRSASTAISTMTQDVVNMHQLSQGVLEQFEHYVTSMAEKDLQVEKSIQMTAAAVENINAVATQQALHLAKLQEYQAALQQSQQEYIAWTDKFLVGAQKQTIATSKEIERVADRMTDASALLNSSYISFVEQVEEGLAKASALMDENVSGALKQMNRAIDGINQTTSALPQALTSTTRKYGTQVAQFVAALKGLETGMDEAAHAATSAAEALNKAILQNAKGDK